MHVFLVRSNDSGRVFVFFLRRLAVLRQGLGGASAGALPRVAALPARWARCCQSLPGTRTSGPTDRCKPIRSDPNRGPSRPSPLPATLPRPGRHTCWRAWTHWPSGELEPWAQRPRRGAGSAGRLADSPRRGKGAKETKVKVAFARTLLGALPRPVQPCRVNVRHVRAARHGYQTSQDPATARQVGNLSWPTLRRDQQF